MLQVPQLQQLTQVCFTLRSRVNTTQVQQLLNSLLQLPQLATLAMPVQLLCTGLCSQCSNAEKLGPDHWKALPEAAGAV